MNGAEQNSSVSPMNVMGTESPDPRGMLNFASGFLETAMQTPAAHVAPKPQTKKTAPRRRWKKDPEMVLVDFKKKEKHGLWLVLKELKVINHEDEAAKLRKYIEGKSKEAEQEKETGDSTPVISIRRSVRDTKIKKRIRGRDRESQQERSSSRSRREKVR